MTIKIKYPFIISLGLLVVLALPPLLLSHTPENLRIMYEKIDEIPLPEGRVYYDIPYGGSLLKKQTLDIYTPLIERKTSPALVYIHGGSWLHGDKKMIRLTDRFLRNMRNLGFTVISINYTAGIYGGLHAPLTNCTKALEWILTHGDEYGYDQSLTGIYGVSAGAHLALMTALEDEFLPIPLRYILAECGPTDLNAMMAGDAFGASAAFRLLGSDTRTRYSPAMRANELDLPVMIVHGTADETVALNQAQIMREKLSESGQRPVYLEIEGGNHGFLNCEELWPMMEKEVLSFITKAVGTVPQL